MTVAAETCFGRHGAHVSRFADGDVADFYVHNADEIRGRRSADLERERCGRPTPKRRSAEPGEDGGLGSRSCRKRCGGGAALGDAALSMSIQAAVTTAPETLTGQQMYDLRHYMELKTVAGRDSTGPTTLLHP